MRYCPTCSMPFDDAEDTCPHDGARLTAWDPLLGRVIEGRYRIDALLGAGSMGAVYRATQLMLDRAVAIKIVRSESVGNATAVERFKREALVVARLRHPHIVTIHDFGAAPGLGAYIVMEHLNGRTLRDEVKTKGRLEIPSALAVARQICQGVAEAHLAGVIHRDLKPHNIMLEDASDGVRATVLDFGIAKLIRDLASDPAAVSLTGAEGLLGTPLYMSPEQCMESAVDARSDVYSLGCVLFEMLAGRPPFTGGSVPSLLMRHVSDDPPAPSEFNPAVPKWLDTLVLRALAKAPEDRFQTARAMGEALVAAVEPPALADPRLAGARPAAPFVDRVSELGELHERLRAAERGECQIALVAGEAGTGKSRLLEAFESTAAVRGVAVLHGRFVEIGQSFPYIGFFEVIHEHFRRHSRARVELEDLAPQLAALFPALLEVEGFRSQLKASPEPVAQAEPRRPEDRTAVFEALALTLMRIAGGQPLVILLEDLHAADVSVDALQYVVRRLVPVPLLVVGTYRSEEVSKRHPVSQLVAVFRGDSRFALLELGPLGPDEHRAMVEGLLGGRIDEGLAEQLRDTTEGNPYFTRELVESFKESGVLVEGTAGVWDLADGAGALAGALPETIQEVVRRRIEELPDPVQEVLSIAAVLGPEFEYESLEALAPDEADLERTVEGLVEKGFLEEERRSRGDRIVFASRVVREVLYGALPKRRRKALHRRHAEALEQRYATKIDRVLSQLVHHYAQADVGEKVVQHGFALALRSLDALAADDTVRVAQMVLEYASEDGEKEVEGEVRMLLGSAHRLRGNVGAATAEYEAAIKAFGLAKCAVQMLSAMERAAEAAWEARRVAQARRWMEAGIAAARAAGERDALVRLLTFGTTLSNLAGEYERARTYADEAASLRPERHADEEVPRGGRLAVALGGEIQARHPAQLRFFDEFEVFANVYEPLLAWDARGGLVTQLAEAWETEDDGRAFLFTLRSGVRLHDGRALTTDEVQASFERAARLSGQSPPPALEPIRGVDAFVRGEADRIGGIEVVSSTRLRIRLESAMPIYPALLTDLRAAVAVEPTAPGAHPVGTGPFVVRALEAERASLDRAPDHWREPARLDGIEFQVVPRSAERAAGIRSGRYDLAGNLDLADLEAVLYERTARANVVEAPKKGTCFLLFNSSSAVARAPGAVWALTSVVRVHDLVRSTLGRFAQPAEGLLPPGILGHDANRRRRPISADEAAGALGTSGLALPLRLRASISPGVQAQYEALLGALFREWSALGVTVSIETPTLTSHMASWEASEGFDFTVQNWAADYDDPDNFTYSLFHSESGLFRRYYSSEEVDRLIEQARAEARPAAREQLYRRIEGQLIATGLLPLFHVLDCRVAGEAVRGVALGSTPPYVNYARLGRAESAVGASPVVHKRTTLHVPWEGVVWSIDPATVTTTTATEAALTVFETLLRPSPEAGIMPWLASDFRVEDGGTRLEFRLREDVQFHNGRRMTARDVRYSFERLLRGQSPYRQLLMALKGAEPFAAGNAEGLDGFRIHSTSEFALELERPLSILPMILTHGATAIVPEDMSWVDGTWRAGCIGTGPFRVAGIEPGRQLELEANPYYWRRGYPKSDRLVFSVELESSERAAGFRGGRYSVVSHLRREDEEALLRDREYAARGFRGAVLGTSLVLLNAHRGPMADAALRHRFAAALDVEAFVGRTLGSKALPAYGLIPPGLLGYEARAATMRRAPRGDSGETIELTAAMRPSVRRGWGGELIAWLADRGFRVRVVNETYEELARMRAEASVDMIVTGWYADYPDPDSVVYSIAHSRDGQCGAFVENAEIDRLCELGRIESDGRARHAIYCQIEELLARHALVVPLFHTYRWWFVRPEVEGVELSIFQPYLAYEKLSAVER